MCKRKGPMSTFPFVTSETVVPSFFVIECSSFEKFSIYSAAKCHEYHEIFTNENNEHIRGSLMLIADTQ